MTALILIAIIAVITIIISFIQTDLAVGVFTDAFGSNTMDSVTQILSLTSSWLKGEDGYYSIINTVFDAIKPLGIALITTYFIIRIIDLASADGLSFDMLVKSLIQLVLVYAIATNSDTIINAILSVGESALNSISVTVSGGVDSGVIEALAADFAASTLAVLMALELLVIYILHFVVIIGMDVAAISRLIDIGWRAAFMPVGVANCFSNGTNSAGIQYIKSFIGSVLSGAAMVAIIAIGMSLSTGFLGASSTFSNGVTRTFLAMAAQLATVGAAIGIPSRMREIIA